MSPNIANRGNLCEALAKARIFSAVLAIALLFAAPSFAADKTNNCDSLRVSTLNMTPESVVMLCVAIAMVLMNNYNPKR